MKETYERVCDEQQDLSEKIKKLETFRESKKYQKISTQQRHLLGIQLQSMKTYNKCLLSRIMDFQFQLKPTAE
jgi:hypothetical protein